MHELFEAIRTWLPIAIAASALIVSLMNRKTASRALAIGKAQEERQLRELNFTLEQSRSVGTARTAVRWIEARLLVVNPADRDTSVVNVELRVTFEVRGMTLLANLSPESIAPADLKGETIHQFPLNVPANSARSGWIAFKLPKGLIAGPISSFSVILNDSSGATAVVDLWGLRDSGTGS